MKVVGIDPSLTSTGVVVLDENLSPAAHLVRSRGHRADSWTARAARCAHLADQIVALAQGAHLVVVEGPAYAHSAEPGFYDRAMLMGLIMTGLASPTAVVAPATVKKWIASTGTAPKALVAARVRRLLPDLEVLSFDVTDAAAMALIGASHLNLLTVSPARKGVEETICWEEA